MKLKKTKINFDELETAIADATCRMEAEGLLLPQQSPEIYEPTFWQRIGKYEYGYNSRGYTNEVRCAA